ncbi:hypothetical protein MKC70_19755 [[Clostridium] innocuum]|nr:hypothetical protein [Erysipelotrichaceae bacterium]MCR0384716.1 hypothetical protein [[Clostridium] innocuum]
MRQTVAIRKSEKIAYQLLADIKHDADIEKLFIDYIVACEDSHDVVLPIVQAYWEEEN